MLLVQSSSSSANPRACVQLIYAGKVLKDEGARLQDLLKQVLLPTPWVQSAQALPVHPALDQEPCRRTMISQCHIRCTW